MTLFDADPTAPDVDSEAERRALVALMLVPNVGWSRARTLIGHLKRPSAVFSASASVLTQVPGIGPRTAAAICSFDDHAAVDRQFARADEMDVHLCTLWDTDYPGRLRHTYDPPPCLWIRGTLHPADTHALAVVGTRRCTDYGKGVARDLTAALVQHGYTIVSGLAFGIDAAAHRAALKQGGRTLAVLGSGLARIYPQKHTRLARRIEDQGAVLSEYTLDEDPNASNFPERNRIVSGLTLGTLVIESHEKGGALITARLAVEQNREVFAVPGPVGKSASVGTNRLIQRGHAKLVLNVDDLLAELPTPPTTTDSEAAPPKEPPPDLSNAEQTLYDVLTNEPVHLDVLCARAGVAPSEALVHLLQLEFKDLVEQRAGKQFQRVR
ncbi:MAG: DNA-processing protein DprA [Longimonas sp.]|uniref:DNA-processing protein DprA n=1 Tax=Longimonas sp. TaxID=2039626 RepID=UPI003976C3F4